MKLLLVSGGFTFFTDRLRQRLGLDYTISNELELDGDRLTGRLAGRLVDAHAKAARFREVAHALGAAREQTVAIGDGANDLQMMAEAGLSVAYRAKPVVKAKADCALDFAGLDGVAHGRMLDLKAVAGAKLEAAGAEHVHDVDRCTYCEPDVFFSHRRDRGITGRMAAMIGALPRPTAR